jgi:microsomal epoxide hydrolase
MEFLDVIEPLQQDFHVIAPSLPGFGFSGETSEKGWHPRRIAEAFADVMAELGYERYGLQGGDWGSAVSANVADLYPDRVIGLHLNMVIARPVPDAPLLDDEKLALDRAREWRRTGTGYQEIQGTRPQSLGYALQDSPAGLAAWIVEKFQDWSDGDIADAYTFDRLLDNVMAYWVTGTAASSLRIYWEMRHNGPAAIPQARVTVPTAVAMFPGEIVYPPRSWTEAAFNVVRWSKPTRGGHFAAMEAPAEYVEDVRSFFRELQQVHGVR